MRALRRAVETEQMRRMIIIQSEKHELYTEEVNKMALSAEDDKRIIQKHMGIFGCNKGK